MWPSPQPSGLDLRGVTEFGADYTEWIRLLRHLKKIASQRSIKKRRDSQLLADVDRAGCLIGAAHQVSASSLSCGGSQEMAHGSGDGVEEAD